MRHQTYGTIMVLISAAGFGMMGIIAKYAYDDGMNVNTLLTFRFLFASLFFWLIISLLKIDYSIGVKNILILLAMGAGGYGVMSTLLFNAFYYIPASLGEMLFYTYPVLVCILGHLIEKERIDARKGFVLVTSFIGLVFILGSSIGFVNFAGILFTLGSAVVYAFFITYSNRLLKDVPPFISSTYIATFAGVTLLVKGIIVGDIHLVSGTIGWSSVIGVAFLSTFIALITFFEGVKHLGPSKASIYSMSEPVITFLLGILLLGEHFSMIQIAGIFIIFCGILILNTGGKKAVKRRSKYLAVVSKTQEIEMKQ